MRKCLRCIWLVGLLALDCAPLLQASDFPRWRGAGSNGSAGETTMPLAESWDEVHVAWVSEVASPHPWNYSVVRGKTQWPRTVLGNGGYCQPSIWDGKVYVGYWKPSGTAHATKGEGKYPSMWVASRVPAYTLIEADACIVCMDAATGRTLWEAAWSGHEMNHVELYGGHNNICIANGKAYAIGNTGWVYCADAKTGAKLWAMPVGPSAKAWEQFKARCIKEGLKSDNVSGGASVRDDPPHPQGGSLHSQTYNICPVVADGVLVTGEWSAGSDLVGFDGQTGKELWRLPGGGGGVVPPLLWRHAGKEYLVKAAGSLLCLEPRTGRKLWTAGPLGNAGYDSATAAIEGDYIVAHGAWHSQRSLPPEQQEGWVCYKLSPEKAEKTWVLNAAYKGTGYIAPVVHRGYAWLTFERGEGMSGLTECNTAGASAAIACVELATGKVVSEVSGFPMNSVCPGPVAMGDLLAYQGGEYVWLMSIAKPKTPQFLGSKPQPVNLCSSATAAAGRVYFRSAERLVACLDVRKPAARQLKTRCDDPANALFDLTMTEALRDGGTPHFCLRGRKGQFPQSWATLPPGHSYPDVLEPGTLKIEGNRLAGQVKALLGGAPYEYRLNAELANGQVTGEYEDCYRGVPCTDEATGTMLAWANRNGEFSLYWPRHWVGGQNQGHEHIMTMTLADGKVTAVKIAPRLPQRPGIGGTVDEHKLRFDGSTLTGTALLTIKTDHVAVSGKYKLEFELSIANNLFSGVVRSTREGAQTTTHNAWGHATAPPTEPVTSEKAVFWVDLKRSVAGKMDTRLYLSSEGGRIVGGIASARGNAGLQRVDFSGLRFDKGRLVGRAVVCIKADGYVLRADSQNVYDVDLGIKGNEVAGKYEGTYDSRAPRRGKITGEYRNED